MIEHTLYATCPRCHRGIVWAGAYRDRPPCPRCGHQISREEIEQHEASIEHSTPAMAGEGQR